MSGCLRKFLFFAVILIGIIIYLINQYGSTVVDEGKKKLTEVVVKEIYDELDYATDNVLADSLKDMLTSKLSSMSDKDWADEYTRMKDLLKSIRLSYRDALLDTTEFELIREIITYERSEEN